MAQSLARRIATAAAKTRFEDFSPETVAKLKLCLLDFFACAFEARDLPWSQRAAILAGRERGAATVLATGATATPGAAAFANGTAGHGLVREDMHAGSVSHLGVVVLPTLLALSERDTASGRDFITAAIAGYETGAKIGRALVTPDFARFFRPTGFTGPLAAAIAGSRLIAADADLAARALGFAANTTSGLNQWPHEGSDDMFFHPGFAARNALTAIELAELGAQASDGALDGPAGLLTAYLGGRTIPDITLFDGAPELLSVYNKPVPACNFAQTPCQAALSAVSGQPLPTDRIRQIRIAASYAAVHYPGCDYTGPFGSRLQAKMSIQFGVAAALRYGKVAEANYAKLDEPEVMRLAALVRLETDAGFTGAFPARQGSRVEIETTDGKLLSATLPDVVPATEAEIRARFRAAAEETVGAGRTKEIERLVNGLEAMPSVGALPRLAQRDAAPRAAAR
ncbi:MmgE/PrpD family protein [Dongia sedimenti]|uniref:MmgE/PrpD family protein n=1 Tax=Dongia sedimenti TaxID=3064282 RepID=A0ABU0YRW9_9PROT|nr:MmgE/PrpD family protein [Rhodospirillaceae bacterium R-7]